MDLLIENAKVVDGTGNPWYEANVEIRHGMIVKISASDLSSRCKRINAGGLVVAPGFIDVHTHSDFCLLKNPRLNHKISQGVTTEVIGLCGFSGGPVGDEFVDEFRQFVAPLFGGEEIIIEWRSLGEFLDQLERQGVGPNVASFVGHSAIRIAAMGAENRKPSETELTKMKQLLVQSMLDGAFGLSSGLMYPPGTYALTDELIALCREVSKFGGTYASHIRSYQDRYEQAAEEAINIGRTAKVSVIISHIQSNSRKFWGKSFEVLRMMNEARQNGVDVVGDVHPYLAGSTLLTQLLPYWASSGGVKALLSRLSDSEQRKKVRKDMEKSTDWDNYSRNLSWSDIKIAQYPANPKYEGLTLQQIARLRERDPYETVFDLLVESNCEATMILFMCSEREKIFTMRHPLTMIESDCLATYPGRGKPHPRSYGTFPLFLGEYVRRRKIVPLETAVRKLTSLPAQRLGIHDRGIIAEGMWADIVIFDEEKIKDMASYDDPHQYPEGIRFVIVNGKIVLDDGVPNELIPGRALRHEVTPHEKNREPAQQRRRIHA